MMKHWPPLVMAAIISASPDALAAQGNNTKARSTSSGVYSRVQADRGQDVYLLMCKSCHSAESHTGAVFTTKWNGKALSELYIYIRDQMPKNSPGTLTPEENADVLAYVLKMNRIPDGDGDLPADADALKTIRIETTRPARKTP